MNTNFPGFSAPAAGPEAPLEMLSACQGLKADHRTLEASWQRVRVVLEQVVAGESVPLASDGVEALVSLYERHIEREENELLPMAARLLSEDDLARVGRAMRERRGIGEV